jgi:hypothetical protein
VGSVGGSAGWQVKERRNSPRASHMPALTPQTASPGKYSNSQPNQTSTAAHRTSLVPGMEVGDQLFSSAERESFDSFLADIEDDSLGEATEPFAVYAEHQQGQGSNGSLDGDGAYGRAYASSSWGGAGASGSSRLHPEVRRPHRLLPYTRRRSLTTVSRFLT